LRIDDLLQTVMRTVVESAGAQRGALLLRRDGTLVVEAWLDAVDGQPRVLERLTPEAVEICAAMVRLVDRGERRLVVEDASQDERWRSDPDVQRRNVRSVLVTPLVDKGRQIGLLYLDNNLVPNAFTDDRCQLLDILGAQAAISLENALFLERQQRVQASMERFVPSEFVHLLGKDELTSVALGDAVERELGVLFSDVRGFTSISAAMAPMEIFGYLNGYLEKAGPIIRQCGGFIDKYIGDAILALFPTSAEQAISAVLGLYRAISAYNVDNLRLVGR
jgi:signal transduction protein with GAF and PtsI domain